MGYAQTPGDRLGPVAEASHGHPRESLFPEIISQAAEPASMLKLAARSLAITFKIMPTLLALAITCFTPALALLLVGVMVLNTNKAGAIILIIASVSLGIAAYYYLYGATVLAVWLHLSGIRATFVQILRRMHGKVAMNIFKTGFNAGFRILGGLLLFLVPGLIAYTKYVLAIPVVVVEQLTGHTALQRSKELSSGHRGRIFGGLLLFCVLYYATAFIVAFCLAIASYALAALSGQGPDLSHAEAFGRTLGRTFGQLVSLIMMPAGIVFPVLVYLDIRLRKEALMLPPVPDVETPGGLGAAE